MSTGLKPTDKSSQEKYPSDKSPHGHKLTKSKPTRAKARTNINPQGQKLIGQITISQKSNMNVDKGKRNQQTIQLRENEQPSSFVRLGGIYITNSCMWRIL